MEGSRPMEMRARETRWVEVVPSGYERVSDRPSEARFQCNGRRMVRNRIGHERGAEVKSGRNHPGESKKRSARSPTSRSIPSPKPTLHALSGLDAHVFELGVPVDRHAAVDHVALNDTGHVLVLEGPVGFKHGQC